MICIECNEKKIYKVKNDVCIDCKELIDICRYCSYNCYRPAWQGCLCSKCLKTNIDVLSHESMREALVDMAQRDD